MRYFKNVNKWRQYILVCIDELVNVLICWGCNLDDSVRCTVASVVIQLRLVTNNDDIRFNVWFIIRI